MRDSGWQAVAAAARFAQYGALLAASGGGFFLALVIWDRRPLRPTARRYTLAAASLAAIASALTLGAEGGLLALPALPAGLIDAATWEAGAASPQGPSVALTLLGLALLAWSLRRAGAAPPRALVLAGAVLALAGLAATGHAATAPPRWLGTPMVLLHAVAAAAWIGGLWPLLRVLHAAPAERAAVVRRFSAMAAGAVALLAAAGAGLALLQVRSLPALVETAYGRILLAKIGAVLALLACAAVNKWRLTPALSGARGAAAALGLRRSIGLELALAAAVMAATVALGTVPPPRALALAREAAAAGYAAVLSSPAGIEARIRIRPARAGRNRVEVGFSRAGAPLDPAEATLELSLPAAGIEPHRQSLARTGPGAFRADDAELAPAGRWHVRLDALIGDFERATFEGDVTVGPPP
jgi:copper transport protein